MNKKHNEKNPEGGVFAGLFQHVQVMQTKIEEKEKETDSKKLKYCYA